MKNITGFTLLEIILVLIIVGVITLFSTFGLLNVLNSYLQNREYAQTTLKLNIALSRLTRELKELHSVVKFSSSSIVYKRDDREYSLACVGDKLKFNLGNTYPDKNTGYVLMDKISDFSISLKKEDNSSWKISDNIQDLSKIYIGLKLKTSPTLQVSLLINPWFNDTYNGPR